MRKIALILFLQFLRTVAAYAQSTAIAGPPPPELPATVSRDSEGRATIRAVPLEVPLKLDGRLDEPLYTSVLPLSDFIQTEPNPGEPATEKTEVWISFDQTNVYVSVRASESRPERVVANEMRRDNNTIWQNDGVGFSFDTFYDRRNDFLFNVNPVGGRTDGHIMNEGTINNNDWNPVWDFATARFEGGWTVEVAIPFKSLRYGAGTEQVWGFQMRRNNRWKNEISYVTAVSSGRGFGAVNQMSRAATLVGIEAPPGSRNIEIKPYAVTDLTTDATAVPKINNRFDGDVGLDVKYGLTQNLTADVTFNTDFAQAEADEQQINLTRFSLFFPEKREFFLENQGLFQFGATNNLATGQIPILFYSRRIGLDNGRDIPINAGARVTGRLGRYSIGALTIGTRDDDTAKVPAANFAVMRLKRDILRKSSIGMIATRRSSLVDRAGSNEAYGVDATLAFYNNLSINSYYAQTRIEGLTTDNSSHRLQLDYNGDRYGIQAERLSVGVNFRPEVGYVQRRDTRSHFGQLRFSPRPRSIRSVRKFIWQASFSNIDDGAGRLETRVATGQFGIEFQNGDRFNANYTDNYEFLKQPFPIATGVRIPIGGYNFGNFHAEYTLGVGRAVSGTFSLDQGSFYSGDKTTVAYRTGRIKMSPKFAIEPSISLNRVELPQGAFTTNLVSSRATYSMTPFMFLSGLVQYNSSAKSISTNVRFRWEYTAGSELFVVYNDNRDTLPPGFPALQNRSVIIKINRLLRF
jgi:hypothetical protein